MSSFIKIILKVVVSFLLFVLLIGWFFQALGPLFVFIVVIVILIILIYEFISHAKNRRDRILVIVSVMTILVGLCFILLNYTTNKLFFNEAKLLSDAIQNKCCSNQRCPAIMEGWKMSKWGEQEYFQSDDNWRYGFSTRMYYRIVDDGQVFHLRLRYNIDDSVYFTGGLDQCRK